MPAVPCLAPVVLWMEVRLEKGGVAPAALGISACGAWELRLQCLGVAPAAPGIARDGWK